MIRTCYICEQSLAATQEHHVVPRSRAGADGPTVDLCASCHQTVHAAAASMRRGKYPAAALSHLDEGGRARCMSLVQAILVADSSGVGNPNPLLSVTLNRPEYLKALHMYKRDVGCTSLDQVVNVIARALATRYGLL